MALTHQGRAVASVRLLGPIQIVLADGATVDLPSVSQRRLLAILGLSVGRPLRPDLLSEYLGVTNGGLRTAVARLRSQIGADNQNWQLDATEDIDQIVIELDSFSIATV